jgi:hypothetical protein
VRLLAAGFGRTAKGPPKNALISSGVISEYGNGFSQKEHFTTQRYMAFTAPKASTLEGWDAAGRPKGCVMERINIWLRADHQKKLKGFRIRPEHLLAR